uniref:Uncharacterized protein n=1 Tax=Glypta fumiferanae TaxID=389681 RepID=A0A0F6QA90_9HYME|nr:hypothetical protein [Glypta fumiferanae]
MVIVSSVHNSLFTASHRAFAKTNMHNRDIFAFSQRKLCLLFNFYFFEIFTPIYSKWLEKSRNHDKKKENFSVYVYVQGLSMNLTLCHIEFMPPNKLKWTFLEPKAIEIKFCL